MPVPKYSMDVPSVPLAPEDDHNDGLTELRVHGVSGTPPDALLADNAPVQMWGDRVAGFYRSARRKAPDGVVGRNVEAYSWGGLTSGSSLRVLWLVLLPFLLGNLSGWTCSRRTRGNPVLFGVHRAATSLGSLALTLNAAFAATLITADVAGYQAVRADVVKNSWWLAPMGWPQIAGHPARQVLVGVFVAALVVLAVHLLVGRSLRYEKVRPPHRTDAEPPGPARLRTAAALDNGLRDKSFWDGARSTALLAWVHSAAYTAFLAVVLAFTARSATGGTAAGDGSAALFWVGSCTGGAVLAGCVLYLIVDAGAGEAPALRKVPPVLAGLAIASLVCVGVFAWLQPAFTNTATDLPGIATVFHWAAIGFAACAVLVACSVLLGLDRQWRSTFAAAPLACLLLGFGLLNVMLLCLLDWTANLAGPVTVKQQVPKGSIYIPNLVWYGAPMLAWALVAAAFLFFAKLLINCLWRSRRLPQETAEAYQTHFDAKLEIQGGWTGPGDPRAAGWYTSALGPDVDAANQGWSMNVSRWLVIGSAARSAATLVWLIIIFQLAISLSEWAWPFVPPHFLRYTGTALAGLILPVLAGFILSAWSNPSRRRGIGIIWDVGTFWPRSFHPFAPPCYAERAVPDLQRRVWWLRDNGGKVIMVAHSQGAILAAAAFAQEDCQPRSDPDDPRTALITFGNPLTRLYAWGFPGYITPEFVRPLIPGPGRPLQAWHNYWYATDPIGSMAISPLLEQALQQAAPEGHASGNADKAAEEQEEDSAKTLSDHGTYSERFMLDPANCGFVYGTTAKPPGGHSGYWSDHRVWDDIDQVAADLTTGTVQDTVDGTPEKHGMTARRFTPQPTATSVFGLMRRILGRSRSSWPPRWLRWLDRRRGG